MVLPAPTFQGCRCDPTVDAASVDAQHGSTASLKPGEGSSQQLWSHGEGGHNTLEAQPLWSSVSRMLMVVWPELSWKRQALPRQSQVVPPRQPGSPENSSSSCLPLPLTANERLGIESCLLISYEQPSDAVERGALSKPY